MNPDYLAKTKKWKEMEGQNTKSVLAKLTPMLRGLGFTKIARARYQIQLGGRTCEVGISKLSRTPALRIYVHVREGPAMDELSDAFTYKGHPSGLKFSFNVSRFKDNSEECAGQVVSFVTLVALPWFYKQVN